MTVFKHIALQAIQQGSHLAVLLLCALITFIPAAHADLIVSTPATLTIPGFSGQTASANVTLTEHNDASIQFTDASINLTLGETTTTNLQLSNTGVNPLQTSTINISLPTGITATDRKSVV